jgi:hypothetical protein
VPAGAQGVLDLPRDRDRHRLPGGVEVAHIEDADRKPALLSTRDQINAVGQGKFAGCGDDVDAVALAERHQDIVHGRFLAPDFDVIGLQVARRIEREPWNVEARGGDRRSVTFPRSDGNESGIVAIGEIDRRLGIASIDQRVGRHQSEIARVQRGAFDDALALGGVDVGPPFEHQHRRGLRHEQVVDAPQVGAGPDVEPAPQIGEPFGTGTACRGVGGERVPAQYRQRFQWPVETLRQCLETSVIVGVAHGLAVAGSAGGLLGLSIAAAGVSSSAAA